GTLSFSLLFASAALQLVATLARAADPVGACWLSSDVLLLPQSLLPLTVRYASGVFGALPATALPWRAGTAVVPKFAPLFSLSSAGAGRHSVDRCDQVVHLSHGLRHWRGVDSTYPERVLADGFYFWLQFLAPPGRWQCELLLACTLGETALQTLAVG